MEGKDNEGFCINVYSEGNFIAKEMTFNAPVNVGSGAGACVAPRTEEDGVDFEAVGKALRQCEKFFWGKAAMATVFCVCRDLYNMPDNASLFERHMAELQFDCPAGTIANAMRNNPYMKLNVRKWEERGALPRVLTLAREFRQQMNAELGGTT